MATTKCDILRDVARANMCGMCTASANCGTSTPPSAVCNVANIANAKMKLFASQYSPANLYASSVNKAIRTQEEKIYQGIIQKGEADLKAAYPTAPAEATVIEWSDFEHCLWNKDGTAGGNNKNVYFKRDDAVQLGMAPVYPIGGSTIANVIWKGPTSPIPLAVDYLMNPDLFTILMFVLLVIIFSALMWSVWRTNKWAAYLAEQSAEAAQDKLEENDPFKGTAVETHPNTLAKIRKWIEAQEQLGYTMTKYRNQYNIPTKPTD